MSMEATHLDIENHSLLRPDGTRAAATLEDGRIIAIHPIIHGLPGDLQSLYLRSYADCYAEAKKLQGATAFDHGMESAAAHETGHVIIAVASGFNIEWSRIWEAEPGMWVGFTESLDRPVKVGMGPGTSVANNILMARNVMAGYVSERVFEGEAAREGSSIDERVAALLLCSFAGVMSDRVDATRVLYEAETEVTRIITANEQIAKRIADALIEASPNKLEGQRLAG